jgi:hypothetical protein
MKNYKVATIFATTYLVVYTVMHQLGAPLEILAYMFILSPLIVGWMAYTIIRYAPFDGRELDENEEWGYSDRSREDL